MRKPTKKQPNDLDPQVLTIAHDLLALAKAAIVNARELLGDAELLCGGGKFPRALALATFSQEEVSKANLCLLAVALPEITAEDFWESFRDHEGKLVRVRAFAALMKSAPVVPVAQFARGVIGQSRSTAKLRQRALYVDYRRGQVEVPSQIGETGARNQIKAAKTALATAEAAFPADSLNELLAQFDALSGPLRNAIVADPDATAAALQEALQGGSQEKLQALMLRYAALPGDAG